MIDIQEVGTGGGSIARVETGGALRVGPESAGAQPGPVCYGQGGTEPTITDANLVLGPARRRTASSAARCSSISSGAKRRSTSKIAKPLGLDLIEAADGILRIAATKMSHMVRWVTTERGLDAADFALVAYGGAGPLHAAMVARELRIAEGHHPVRARAFLGLRHAGRRSAARLRQHLVHSRSPTRRSRTWRRFTRRWRSGAAGASRAAG